MVMKASLQLKLGQSLTMTPPQLQQAIRLLQLSTLDLQQEIQQALESNPPMLETSEDDEHAEGDEHEEHEHSDASSSEANQDDSHQDASPDWDETENGPDWSSENDIPDNIPDDLPVDTAWDDIYQSAPPLRPAKAKTSTNRFRNPELAYRNPAGSPRVAAEPDASERAGSGHCPRAAGCCG